MRACGAHTTFSSFAGRNKLLHLNQQPKLKVQPTMLDAPETVEAFTQIVVRFGEYTLSVQNTNHGSTGELRCCIGMSSYAKDVPPLTWSLAHGTAGTTLPFSTIAASVDRE